MKEYNGKKDARMLPFTVVSDSEGKRELRSLALGLVTLMASCAALSTMAFRFLEDTL